MTSSILEAARSQSDAGASSPHTPGRLTGKQHGVERAEQGQAKRQILPFLALLADAVAEPALFWMMGRYLGRFSLVNGLWLARQLKCRHLPLSIVATGEEWEALGFSVKRNTKPLSAMELAADGQTYTLARRWWSYSCVSLWNEARAVRGSLQRLAPPAVEWNAMRAVRNLKSAPQMGADMFERFAMEKLGAGTTRGEAMAVAFLCRGVLGLMETNALRDAVVVWLKTEAAEGFDDRRAARVFAAADIVLRAGRLAATASKTA